MASLKKYPIKLTDNDVKTILRLLYGRNVHPERYGRGARYYWILTSVTGKH
jgi:hypothetical protein